MLHFIYQWINLILLLAIVWFLCRKMIFGMLDDRTAAIEEGLTRAEAFEAGVREQLEPVAETEEARELLRREEELNAALSAEKQAEEAELHAISEHEQSVLEEEDREALNGLQAALAGKACEQALRELSSPENREKFRAAMPKMVEELAESVTILPGTELYLEGRSSLTAKVVSAFPLGEELQQRLEREVAEHFASTGISVFMDYSVDESLIGGLRMEIGDTLYDHTVLSALSRVEEKTAAAPIRVPKSRDIKASIADLSKSLKKSIPVKSNKTRSCQIGRVLSVYDGICWAEGLSDIMFGEVVLFENDERGMVLELDKDKVGCVIFGAYENIHVGSTVRRAGTMMSVPTGSQLLGRVVNALGRPIDGKGPIVTGSRRPIERSAPTIPMRKSVSVPLHTGIKAIDALIPIGRGQRELIIGDRQTGKTSIAIDTILNQKDTGVRCIYVAVGQKESSVARTVSILQEHGAMAYTTVVCATSSDPAAMQYVAPFAGAAMAEHFMYKGGDALVVYDDLSKHAVAYRELSLLLHRPSGREAYPGDVFYLHSRLLERSARLNEANGGGSMTAMPIVETLAGDISAYIPTNVISITDGQVYLESELFHEGQRPAVNVGLSVSRVGGAAQTKLLKQVSGMLRLQLAQYRELASFAQFGSDLDAATGKTLKAGALSMAALRQGLHAPLENWQQALLIYAVSNGYAEGLAPEKMPEYEAGLFDFFRRNHRDLTLRLAEGSKLEENDLQLLKEALSGYRA